MKPDWPLLVPIMIVQVIYVAADGVWPDHPALPIIFGMLAYIIFGTTAHIRGRLSDFKAWYHLLPMAGFDWIAFGRLMQLEGYLIYAGAAVAMAAWFYFLVSSPPPAKETAEDPRRAD